MNKITTYKSGDTKWYSRKDGEALSLSETIQILQKVMNAEGDINVWEWSDGIAKRIKRVHLIQRSDGLVGAFLEV